MKTQGYYNGQKQQVFLLLNFDLTNEMVGIIISRDLQMYLKQKMLDRYNDLFREFDVRQWRTMFYEVTAVMMYLVLCLYHVLKQKQRLYFVVLWHCDGSGL